MSKLIIVGAGGHGRVIKEIAEELNQFELIDFVDDNLDVSIGKISDLEGLHNNYDSAFISIGNNEIRKALIYKIKNIGYKMPCLIHPTAYVSKSAKIGDGSVIEPNAVVNANSSIGDGCIISVGAIVDHDCTVGDYCHLNSGSIVRAGSKINEMFKLDLGQIFE